MKLSVLYWNIWLDNQIDGHEAAEPLLQELRRIIEQYRPDCIGLNEILQHHQATTPFVLDYLKQLGYGFTHFAPASPFTNDWIIGAGIASKYQLESVTDVKLSEDVPAKKRGHDNCTVKAITARVILPSKKKINMIVAHPLYLRPSTKEAHYTATKKLQSLMLSEDFATGTVLGGDFNESVHWLGSFNKAMRTKLNFRTGTMLHPTWLHNARPWTPLRANIDQIYWTKDGSITLQKFEVITSKASDHRPLFAQFEVAYGSSRPGTTRTKIPVQK